MPESKLAKKREERDRKLAEKERERRQQQQQTVSTHKKYFPADQADNLFLYLSEIQL